MMICKSVRISKKGQFVIPKQMREVLGIKEGGKLLVTLEGGRVVLTLPKQFAKTTRGILKGSWGKTGQEVECYIKRERGSWP
jgi:AbrB family looped-hinge helix DNA binding protein